MRSSGIDYLHRPDSLVASDENEFDPLPRVNFSRSVGLPFVRLPADGSDLETGWGRHLEITNPERSLGRD